MRNLYTPLYRLDPYPKRRIWGTLSVSAVFSMSLLSNTRRSDCQNCVLKTIVSLSKDRLALYLEYILNTKRPFQLNYTYFMHILNIFQKYYREHVS